MDSSQTELERGLVSRIERDGPITFRDFMQSALYDERLGYYNTGRLKIGAEGGDYYTASNVHPAFGAVLAQAFFDLWQELLSESEDGPLTIVEIGAGTGQLACDILSAIGEERPAAFQNLSYIIVEASPAMRARQQEKLAPLAGPVRWQGLEELERQPSTAIAFSNELVDAMPVHRVLLAGGGIQEQYVGLGQGSDGAKRLSLCWAAPSTEEISAYIDRMKVGLAEGQVIEVNLDAVRWVERMARAIRHGFLVTIDYGEEATRLYAPDRTDGTLRSFRRHRLIDSPLEAVGEQDITASVNFTALIEYGRDFGFGRVSYERQAAFLIRNGLIDRISTSHGDGSAVHDLKGRLAIKNLFVPGGISDNFRVLIQKK